MFDIIVGNAKKLEQLTNSLIIVRLCHLFSTIYKIDKFIGKEMYYFFLSSSYYPFINPIVNPADILPVRGIPKLVIANEAAGA